MITYELIPLSDNAERSHQYLVCADDAEALTVARLLRFPERALLWQDGRNLGHVAPLTPFARGRHR